MKTNPELDSDAESSEEHDAEKLSSASSDAASDAEDVFKLAVADESILSGEYKTLFLYRWQKVATELKVNHLRSDLTLPMDPTAEHKSEVWKNVDDGVVLPTWHCGFKGCTVTSADSASNSMGSHEFGLWQHIWGVSGHRSILDQVLTKYSLVERFHSKEEAAFTLVNQAYLASEGESCPVVGLSTDRRALQHLGEVFFEKNVEVLLCFICSCKHIHHRGFDKLGKPLEKGTIAYRSGVDSVLKDVLCKGSHTKSWTSNLSMKRFKNIFGAAVKSDPFLQDDVFEWKRKVQGRRGDDEALCCPEDVVRSEECMHDDITVCSNCCIPICHECWNLAKNNDQIPKALANDNVISYAHPFIVAEKVTWLEATIAAPVFSGLVTYYIEGDPGDKHNLMQVPVGHTQKSWGVRGNLFSFLLPWDKVLQQLFEKIEDGDLKDWPLSPDVVRQVVRVSFTRGPEGLLSKFKELHIRSWVVKKLAHIYIENRVQDLANRPGVLTIHAYERCVSVASSLKQHADRRIDHLYPSAQHNSELGALLPGLAEIVQGQRETTQPIETPPDSNFDLKQSTMHDNPQSPHQLFAHVRPSIVTDEGESSGTYAPEVVLDQGLSNVANMNVRMSNQFEDQFISKYMPRIFPWALNYDCGGPEFPALFENWDDLMTNQDELLARGIQQRWRKLAGEAVLVPGDYARMLATRPEVQVSSE